MKNVPNVIYAGKIKLRCSFEDSFKSCNWEQKLSWWWNSDSASQVHCHKVERSSEPTQKLKTRIKSYFSIQLGSFRTSKSLQCNVLYLLIVNQNSVESIKLLLLLITFFMQLVVNYFFDVPVVISYF